MKTDPELLNLKFSKLQHPFAHQSFGSMSKTAQMTDIYKFVGMYAANIDFQRQEYRVFWHSDWRSFADFGSFPQVPGATVT